MLLANDLQGVGNAGGENRGIADGQPAYRNAFDTGFLKQEHTHSADDGYDKALDAIESKSIQLKPHLIDEDDLHSESKSAAKPSVRTRARLGFFNGRAELLSILKNTRKYF